MYHIDLQIRYDLIIIGIKRGGGERPGVGGDNTFKISKYVVSQ